LRFRKIVDPSARDIDSSKVINKNGEQARLVTDDILQTRREKGIWESL